MQYWVDGIINTASEHFWSRMFSSHKGIRLFVVVILAIVGCLAVCCFGRAQLQKQEEEAEEARGQMKHLVDSNGFAVDET